MINTILLMVAILWIAGCQKGNPVAADNSVQRYFPLAKGNTWIYDVTEAAFGDTTLAMSVTIDSIYNADGLQWYHASNSYAPIFYSPVAVGRPASSYSIDENKLIAIKPGAPDPRFRWQITVFEVPLTIGKHWFSRFIDTTYFGNNGSTKHVVEKVQRFVRGINSVIVPAGIYSCIHVEDSTVAYWWEKSAIDTLWDSTFIVTHEWYAPQVGMVKQTIIGSWKWNYGPSAIKMQNNSRTSELRQYYARIGN